MQVQTGLSIRFAAEQNAYRLGLLITVSADPPPDRPERNVTVDVRVLHEGAARVMFYQRFPLEAPEPDCYVVRLGDLPATSPRQLGLALFVDDLGAPGAVPVAEVRVAGEVTVDDAIQRRVIALPIVATLDGTDHVDPAIDRIIVRFQAARAREDAVQQANTGNFDGAANTLRVARDSLSMYASQVEIAKEMADLAEESVRLARREYDRGADR